MLKYMLKVYDSKSELIMQLVIPADELFDTLKEFQGMGGCIKAYLLDEDV